MQEDSGPQSDLKQEHFRYFARPEIFREQKPTVRKAYEKLLLQEFSLQQIRRDRFR